MDWFTRFKTELAFIVLKMNIESDQEKLMAVQVKSLADSVRSMKEMMAKVDQARSHLQTSVENVTSTLKQVDDMTAQLDQTHAELQAAVGQLSNGGPPLDDHVAAPAPAPVQPAPEPAPVPGLSPNVAASMVSAANK